MKTLPRHPGGSGFHVHVMVTAGGLDGGGEWREAKKSCVIPRKALTRKFRGKPREFWEGEPGVVTGCNILGIL
ncbi:MAG: transposase [Pirellulaceae bacterium]